LISGKHFLKGDEYDFHGAANDTLDNRQRFLNMVTDLGVTICNTKFEKPDKLKCTHNPHSTVRDESTWSYDCFNQQDYILVDARHKNGCINAASDPDAIVDSDHYPVWVHFRFKLKIPKPSIRQERLALNPDDSTKKKFNRLFRTSLRNCGFDGNHTIAPDITQIDSAFEAAKNCIDVRPPKIKMPWISEETYKLIEEKHELEQKAKHDEHQQMCKKVENAKRTDWKKFVHESVMEEMDIRDKWMGIKYVKNKHSPNLYERADRPGNTVSSRLPSKETMGENRTAYTHSQLTALHSKTKYFQQPV